MGTGPIMLFVFIDMITQKVPGTGKILSYEIVTELINSYWIHTGVFNQFTWAIYLIELDSEVSKHKNYYLPCISYYELY